MNQDPVTISRIDWLRVFPILHLWKAVRMGVRVRVLVPCLLIPAWLFADTEWSPTRWRFVLNETPALNPNVLAFPTPINTVGHTAWQIYLDTAESALAQFSTLLLATMLTTFIGIAVARATASEFCRETRSGVIVSFIFAAKNFGRGLISLSLALCISALPLLAFVGISRLPALFSMNSWVTNASFPFIVAMSLLSVLTGVVCATGWLLSLAAIGTDRCSGSDALSRGINYVLSHKLYALTIVGSTTVFACVCARIVRNLLLLAMALLPVEFGSILRAGSVPPRVEIWDVWLKGLGIIPNAVQLGVFLSGMTIGYILLREAEDAVHLREMDGGTPSTARETAVAQKTTDSL